MKLGKPFIVRKMVKKKNNRLFINAIPLLGRYTLIIESRKT